MRAKVILSASAAALALLTPAVYVHFKASQPPAAVAEPMANDTPPSAAAPAVLPVLVRRAAAGTAQAHEGVQVQEDPASDLNAPDHEQYVTRRNAELSQMGISQNPASLPTILAELHNPDPAIRSTALTATLDLGSRDAIPALKNEMSFTEDVPEKLAIQKAIDFLQLQPFALDDKGGIAEDAPQN